MKKILLVIFTVALVNVEPSFGAPPDMGDTDKVSRFVSGVVFRCINNVLNNKNIHSDRGMAEACTLGCTTKKLVESKWRHTFALVHKGVEYECVEKQMDITTDPCEVGVLIMEHCKPNVKSAPLVNMGMAGQRLAALFGRLG